MRALPEDYYNPTNDKALGRLIAEALEQQPLLAMPPGDFPGQGLYAIYYVGPAARGIQALRDLDREATPTDAADQDAKVTCSDDNLVSLQRPPSSTTVGLTELYSPLLEQVLKIPLYVGQSIDGKVTKALLAGGEGPTPGPLSRRLATHSASIGEVPGLDIRDFACRFLLVERINADWGEESLKTTYSPVWNSVLRGFGPKAHGGERTTGTRSPWATVHGDRLSRPVGKDNRRGRAEYISAAKTHVDAQVADAKRRLEEARAALGC